MHLGLAVLAEEHSGVIGRIWAGIDGFSIGAYQKMIYKITVRRITVAPIGY